MELGAGLPAGGVREGKVNWEEPVLSGPIRTLRRLGWEEERVPGPGHKDGAEWVPAMLPGKGRASQAGVGRRAVGGDAGLQLSNQIRVHVPRAGPHTAG